MNKSFIAQSVIASNINQRKKQLEMQFKNASKSQNTQETQKQPKKEEASEKDVEPAEYQMLLQCGESVLESLPQIILQSVFIIRSGNDQKLKAGNIVLIFLSVIASLLSIANKFIWVDKVGPSVASKAQSLKPRKIFPGCINYWYLVRVLWRICSIMSTFSIYVLIWTVLGGEWLPICAVILFIAWIIVFMYGWKEHFLGGCAIDFTAMAAVMINRNIWSVFVAKYILNGIGLSMIAVFGTLSFECGICADPVSRQFMNVSDNYRMLLYFIMGCFALGLEILLYIILNVNHILINGKWRGGK
eukprot:102200_1